MTRIRMTHLVTGLVEGGAEMMLARLLSRIDRDRFDSEVISLGEFGPMAERIRATGVPLTILGMRRGRPSVSGFCRLASELRRFRPHVLQTWLYHADIAGLIAGRATGVPAIVWNIRSSDMDMTRYRTLSALTLRACVRWSDRPTAVVVNSAAGQRHHERLGYRPRRWVLIPNGVDTTLFKPDAEARRSFRAELGVPPDTILVGSLARFDPMKDQAGLLRAAATVARSHAGVHFVLGGADVDWNNPVLREAAADPSLQGRVHLLGSCREVPRLMAALDVAVSSSSFGEGLPNVLAEAMSSGVTCVTTDVGDSRVMVGSTGEVVAPGSREALTAAIGRTIQLDPAVRLARGLRARRRMLENYDLPIAVTRYEQLYTSLIEERTCAA